MVIFVGVPLGGRMRSRFRISYEEKVESEMLKKVFIILILF